MSFHPLVDMQQKWCSEGLLAERNRDIEDKESLEEGLFLLVGWGKTTVVKWQQKGAVGCYDNESTCLGLIFIFGQRINNSLDDTSLTGYLFSLYSCSIKKKDSQNSGVEIIFTLFRTLTECTMKYYHFFLFVLLWLVLLLNLNIYDGSWSNAFL